jgi:hypothetical protein
MKCLVHVLALVLMTSTTLFSQSNLDTSHISFWLEYPAVIRGPEAIGEDNYLNEFEYSSGHFRGFTANGCISYPWNCTHAIDGTAAWDMSAPYPSSSFHPECSQPQRQRRSKLGSVRLVAQWYDQLWRDALRIRPWGE